MEPKWHEILTRAFTGLTTNSAVLGTAFFLSLPEKEKEMALSSILLCENDQWQLEGMGTDMVYGRMPKWDPLPSPYPKVPKTRKERMHIGCPKCGGTDIIDASQSLDCSCGHSW